MKILFASQYSSANTYVKSIVDGIRVSADVVTESGNFWSSNLYFDIIHIQWPDELFRWRKISEKDVSLAKKQILFWKGRGAKIVATLHNEIAHENDYYAQVLYDEVYKNADAIVNLGEFSKRIYPNAQNVVIPHPNYNSEITINKKRTEKFTFLSFGKIRNVKEEKQIIQAFLNLKNKNCKLIVTQSKTIVFTKDKFSNPFQYIKHRFYLYNASKNNIVFVKGRLTDIQINDYFNLSDAVVIPRIDNLNSGVLFMGFSFGKVVVGPAIGNITEYLNINENPTFVPENIQSITQAMKNAIGNKNLGTKNKDFSDNNLDPAVIAQKHIKLYHSLLVGEQ